MDFLKMFEQYLLFNKTVSENTLASYLHDVQRYLAFLEKQGICSPCAADEDVTKRFVNYLELSGKSASTISRCTASLRCFYQFLTAGGYTQFNPARNIHPKKEKKKLPQILTVEEIDRLLEQPKTMEARGCRDRAMLELLYATGIRVSELINLDVDDVNLQLGQLRCQSEGHGERYIPIYPAALTAISEYLVRFRGSIADPKSETALFTNLNGHRMTRQGFWKIIKGYAAQAGIEKDITPHMMRHSFAAHLLLNGAELKKIQEMLGHADISSTQIYEQVLKAPFADAYFKCHPRARRA